MTKHANSDDEEVEDEVGDEDDGMGIDLVYPERGGKIYLLKQHSRVQRIVHRGVFRLLSDLCLKNAFPVGADKYNSVARRALVKSAEEYNDSEMVKRLKRDDSYALALASLVCDSSDCGSLSMSFG